MKKRLAKLMLTLVLMVTVICAMAVTAHAETYSGTAKGTKWSVNTDTGVLTIDVEGPMGSWTQGSQPWYKYRDSITTLDFASSTSKITNYAFSDLINLQVIEIPNSVEEIGNLAYVNCLSAREIYIPISIATWGGNVFQGCEAVECIYTENQANIQLTAPIWDASVGRAAEGGKVELQVESKSIGAYAFYGLSSVTEVKLPSTLTSINDYAFYGFTSPFTLDLKSATQIGEYAFYGCTGVTGINLPVATSIGKYAFYNCTGAQYINLDQATSIGESAFENCTAAKSIKASATTCTYGTNAFKNTASCTELYLGSIGFTSGSNALQGMGTRSGFTMTLGKNVPSINGSLQSNHIGTTGPTSLALEDGSTLANVGASAFEGNTMLVSVDLSNRSGGLSIGVKGFNNCSRMTYFRTNTGNLSLTTLAMGNLVKLETLDYSAARTTLGWAPADINVTRTLSGATLSGSTSNNLSRSGSSNVSVEVTTSDSGYGGNNGFNKTKLTGVKYGSARTETYSNTIAATGTAILSYAFSGDNTGAHPFYNMGKDTLKGTTVNFTETVVSIPGYLFTSGIQMVETSSGTQSISPAVTSVSNTNVGSTTPSISGGGVKDAAGNSRKFSHYYYNGNTGWVYQDAPQSCPPITINHASTVNKTLSYAVSSGTKASYATNIKINAANSTSKLLSEIGQNLMGTINYDLATTTSKVTVPEVVSTSTTSSGSKSATATITATSGKLATDSWWYSSYPGASYPYIIFSSNWSSGSTNSSSYTNNILPYIGTRYDNMYTSSSSLEIGTFNSGGLSFYYSQYFGFVNPEKAERAVEGMIGASVRQTISISGSTSTRATTTTAQSTKNEMLNKGNLSTNSYSKASLINDRAATLNLGQSAPSATISQYAFAGDNSIKNVYLAATIQQVGTNAFFTRNSGGTMYIYGHTSADPIAREPGITTNNSYSVQYRPELKDYGIFIKSYPLGPSATAYLYQTGLDEYLLNINGSGATTAFSSSARPGWESDGYAARIKELVVDNGITTLGNYTFRNHVKLLKVSIADSVGKIGDFCFAGCSELPAFTTFPTGLTAIGSGAFSNCVSMNEVIIPTTVKSLGQSIFAGTPISTIQYNATSADALQPGTQPFSGVAWQEGKYAVAIGDNVTSIPAFLFYQSTASTIKIGTGVTAIGSGAFGGCENAILSCSPDNASYMANGEDGNLYSKDGFNLVTYSGAHDDEYYTIRPNVTGIAEGAFYGQSALVQVAFDATITNIGANAFAACPKLKTIAVSDFMDEDSFNAEVTTDKTTWFGTAEVIFSGLNWDIGVTKGAMKATLYSDGTLSITGSGAMKNWASAASVDWYAKRNSITKVQFEGAPTSIGAYAFSGCNALATIILPSTITEIGQYAFYGCSELETVTIPDAVSTIKTYTFANCTKLRWVDTGLGLKSIEPFAFSNCPNARYITLNGTVTEVKANAFRDCTNLTLLAVGKQTAADYAVSDGIVKDDVFRILYMPNITTGRVLTRYACNTSTGGYSYETETDLYAYVMDTDGDKKGDYLHIAGGSAMDPSWDSAAAVPWNGMRETLTKVYVEDDVQSVGPYAFENCTSLTWVKLGARCSALGRHAFYGCSGLKDMLINVREFSTSTINNTSDVFVGAGSDAGFSVVFGDDVKVIPAYMFANCTKLTNLTVGKAVECIYNYAFSGCTKLTTLYLQATNITTTDSQIFNSAGTASGGFTLQLAANVTIIPDSMFYATNNPYVLSVIVDAGSKLQTVGSKAFSGCNRLSSVDFSVCPVLKSIKSDAFSDCTRLVTMDLSNCYELYSIGQAAYKNCMNLSDLDISNDEKLYSLGADAFNGCVNIPSIVLPASVLAVDANTFGNWTKNQVIFVLGKYNAQGFTGGYSGSWSGNATVIYTSLTWDMSVAGDKSIVAYYCVPDDQGLVKDTAIFVVGKGNMKDFAAQNTVNWPDQYNADVRKSITKIVVSDGITRVGNNNFAGFYNAKNLALGADLQGIGVAAFKDCTLIPEVDLSVAAANLTLIENSAFENCSGASVINVSGCDKLTSVGNDAFKNLAGSSVVYVSSEFLYDMLANVNGNIKSTYGTTANTKVVTVQVFFTKDLSSQGVMAGTQVVWNVEATCNDNLAFTWYFATEQGGNWTEISSAMTGFKVTSTTKTSTLTMDPSIVTLDKNGYYFYCKAQSPYYEKPSHKAALAVYSSAITPVVTVVDKNGDSLESNTWTQGPLVINIAPGVASNAITPTYQYKLKASGSWRNAEPIMTYNTEGIVTFYCRAIINGDGNTASEPVKYIIKVDNSTPGVTIAADPEFESTTSVTLTATATDQVSGVQGVTWYKTAADANDANANSGVTGYVPLMDALDMNTIGLSVRHFAKNGAAYTANIYTTTYVGKNETHSVNLSTALDPANEADSITNFNAASAAVTNNTLTKFELYEVHVMDADNSDYAISASNKGIITLPIPADYDSGKLALYSFNKTGVLTPISSFSMNSNKDAVTFSVPSFGQFIVAEKAVVAEAQSTTTTPAP